ncbi:uncharacterized protein [Manis javanica]|uniref:uncharacterized protein n=1 Tax=Manis javanica TaxID=9974 RepID=UPI003C6D7F40
MLLRQPKSPGVARALQQQWRQRLPGQVHAGEADAHQQWCQREKLGPLQPTGKQAQRTAAPARPKGCCWYKAAQQWRRYGGGAHPLMEPDQDPLGRRESWGSQHPKETGALLDHQEGLGRRALEDTREKKETKRVFFHTHDQNSYFCIFGTEGPAVRGRGHAAAVRPARFTSRRRRRPLLDSSWPGRGLRAPRPRQRGCEDEKRSEENPVFYLKTCRECEQTGVKKAASKTSAVSHETATPLFISSRWSMRAVPKCGGKESLVEREEASRFSQTSG